ncbi:DUF1127 domain-containing protein [Pseudomonas sp. S1Bt30]|uniref:DUF1127 domain-containing protein n=1 Tax=Pseudomonas quebecensis TaxID=2995174 RepID=A0ABY6QGH0_9PSED|nr:MULTISPECIES: DUF1127 domain-containing protein [Pseudomonas]MCX4062887.1 DUF1127 domain-containing protein [Pseudomonas quebecensis]UZW18414.1 DUF1127 domain-containing protein [Pseudomonas quebecensis]UZW24172.1 DUF1127 domain-containing protein [Pseudomonas quebecensis]UZW29234.1 DUF1127 domain-containing protein [Pseudomonas quebecensis]
MDFQPALYKRLALRFIEALGRWALRAQGRRQLTQLDLRGLADAGITPGDRMAELSKPFWRD